MGPILEPRPTLIREPAPQLIVEIPRSLAAGIQVASPELSRDSLVSQSRRIDFSVRSDVADAALLFTLLQTNLKNRTKSEIERLKETFQSLYGDVHVSLEHLIRANLQDYELDYALELVRGFSPTYSAEVLHRCLNSSAGELSPDQIHRTLSALRGIEGSRPLKDVSSLVFTFEYSFQRSMADDLDRAIPELRDAEPELFLHISERSNRNLTRGHAVDCHIPMDLRWDTIYLMGRNVRAALHVVGQRGVRDPLRVNLRKLVQQARFKNAAALVQEMILEVMLRISVKGIEVLAQLLEDHADLLLSGDLLTHSRAIDELYFIATGQLAPDVEKLRGECLDYAVMAIANPSTPLPDKLNFLAIEHLQQTLQARKTAEFARMLRELLSPFGAAAIRPEAGQPVTWIKREKKLVSKSDEQAVA